MRLVFAPLVALALSMPAFAADGVGPVREACKADVTVLCAGIQPGGGRIKACLRANRDKLSQGCKSAIAQMIQARQAAKASQPAAQAAPSATTP